MSEDYYVAIGDETKGPYAKTQLKSMWDQGLITCDTRYWNETERDWYLLSNLFEVSDGRSSGAANAPATPLAVSVQLPRLRRAKFDKCIADLTRQFPHILSTVRD